MTVRTFCVLRSGGDYKADDVAILQRNLRECLPGTDLECLSDIDVPCRHVPLQHNWPGWWSKLELFRPDLTGDIFFLDLDTVIVAPIEHLANAGRLTMLRDFFHDDWIASGLMYLPESVRRIVWNLWLTNPKQHMASIGKNGDGGFLRTIPKMRDAARWQDSFPEQVLSYKHHLLDKRTNKVKPLPSEARIVCFHGKPRPRNVNVPWKVA